jgi:HK97 family phage major capsid protein
VSITAPIRGQLQELRRSLKEARDETARLRLAVADGDDAGPRQLAQALNTEAALRAQIEEAEAQEKRGLRRMASNGDGGGYGESFLEDPAMVTLLDRMSSTSQPMDRLELGSFQDAGQMCQMLNSGDWGQPKMYAASTVPDTVVGRRGPITELGIIQQPRRRIRLLDLIPSQEAIGNTVPYIVESGTFTGAEVAESQLKQAGDIGLTDGEAPIRTIAHWLKSPRQILADVPGLEQVLRDRLTYGCLRRLENQIVNGDGTGQNILGILGTTGVGSVTFAAGTALADLSLQGIVAILASEGEPDACVMAPATFQNLLTPKASGSGQYLNVDSPFSASATTMSLWDVPVVTSTLMPANEVLFGNFGQGCRIWIREAVSVVLGMESDDLIRNQVTLLGELRAGLTVNVPSYFCLVHLA